MNELLLNRCRACGCTQQCPDKMISLFNNNIFEIFTAFTSLEVSPNDCLPKRICIECLESITNFSEFRQKCITIDQVLRGETLLQVVKIEPEEKTSITFDNTNDSQDFEAEFYETEYIDEAFSQYDPDGLDSKSAIQKIYSDNPTGDLNEYICDYCDQRFEKKNHIASHMLKHKPKLRSNNFRCNVEDCSKCFMNIKTLTSHEWNEHKIKTEPRIKDNTLVNKKKTKLFCQQCSKWFTMQHKLDAHIRREHEGLKPYKCNHCNKEFCKNRSYSHHMKVRHSDVKIEKFHCPYEGCNREYELQDSLKVHINRFHLGIQPPVRNQKLICDQCGRSFKNGFNLKEHSYSHSGLMPFSCTMCPKKFISNYKLKIHTMRHLDIKNFVCPTCGLRKTTNKELQAHLNFHSKEITYPCKECPRVFASYSAINRHVRIHHRNHKPYICPHCQRAFAKAETMKNHIMTHTGEKPFVCIECGHRFIQNVALKAHMKVHAKKLI